jgi:hypothetical protein
MSGKATDPWKGRKTVSDSTSALVMKRISDEWRPSKSGVTMYAAPQGLVEAGGPGDDRTRDGA